MPSPDRSRTNRDPFDAHHDLACVTDGVAEHCYPDAGAIELKHQWGYPVRLKPAEIMGWSGRSGWSGQNRLLTRARMFVRVFFCVASRSGASDRGARTTHTNNIRSFSLSSPYKKKEPGPPGPPGPI